jgi:hypothetical protein
MHEINAHLLLGVTRKAEDIKRNLDNCCIYVTILISLSEILNLR